VAVSDANDEKIVVYRPRVLDQVLCRVPLVQPWWQKGEIVAVAMRAPPLWQHGIESGLDVLECVALVDVAFDNEVKIALLDEPVAVFLASNDMAELGIGVGRRDTTSRLLVQARMPIIHVAFGRDNTAAVRANRRMLLDFHAAEHCSAASRNRNDLAVTKPTDAAGGGWQTAFLTICKVAHGEQRFIPWRTLAGRLKGCRQGLSGSALLGQAFLSPRAQEHLDALHSLSRSRIEGVE
jgi:hypothetical protein